MFVDLVFCAGNYVADSATALRSQFQCAEIKGSSRCFVD
jgi:hypothetical protein